jgi:hypothetical protein
MSGSNLVDGLTISDVMQAYAQDAVDLARERFSIDLDYSEGSIKDVESILTTMYYALPTGLLSRLLRRRPADEQIWQMAKMWGGYVGEVMRRQWGGEWTSATEAMPGTVITLCIHGSDIYPPAKVYKRLVNGSEDSVWFYYQVLKQELADSQQAQ